MTKIKEGAIVQCVKTGNEILTRRDNVWVYFEGKIKKDS